MEKSHKFKIGQSVKFLHNLQTLRPPLGMFEVIRILPTEHGQRQYRVRSLDDGHERVAAETELGE